MRVSRRTPRQKFIWAGTDGNPDEAKRPYLRHVGFLGAAQPAISGLGMAALASAEEGAVAGPVFPSQKGKLCRGSRCRNLVVRYCVLRGF